MLLRFPLNDKERSQKWERAVRRKHFKPSSSSTLCSLHFVETDFYPAVVSGKLMLKKCAVPTVFDFAGHLTPKVGTRKTLRGQLENQVTIHDHGKTNNINRFNIITSQDPNDENVVITTDKTLQCENETTVVVSQSNSLETEKDQIQLQFNDVLNGISSKEQLNVFKKTLSFAMPTVAAVKNNADKQPFKNLKPLCCKPSPNKLKISPQRRFHSPKPKNSTEKSLNLV